VGDGRVKRRDFWSLALADSSGKEAKRDPDFLHEAPK
jgi:hypothetical protein